MSASFSLSNAASSRQTFSNAGQNSSVQRIANDLLQLNGASRAGTAAQSTSQWALGNQSFAANSQSASRAGQSSAFAASSSAAFGAASSSASRAGGAYLSEIEQRILRATVPVEINETEEITVNGERGIWANRAEVANWRGNIPITEYQINQDANPEIITKRVNQSLEYVQELAVRYLRPPTPPAPGEILIKQDCNTLAPPAPPLIIRQQPARPSTPEPLVIREAPPQAPGQVGRKVITISGKQIPPPPRKVIIERLAALPSKPQAVLVERWLPYAQVKRRVIFQGCGTQDAVVVKPRNVIVQWEAPQVNIRKEVKYLGVIKANPAEYVQRYGAELKVSRDLPQFVHEIKTPDGLVLAADYQYNNLHELEGDLQALKFVDLDREGLSEYRAYLQRLGISFNGRASASFSQSFNQSASRAASTGASALESEIAAAFASVDSDSNGHISIQEAERILLRLNSRLGRTYGEDEVRSFFQSLDKNNDGTIDLEEFRAAYQQL